MNKAQPSLFGVETAEPLLQWVGGKKRLWEQIKKQWPQEFNNYYEPFIGGGYIAFMLGYENTTINDYNPEIANLYLQVKNNAPQVINELNSIKNALPATTAQQSEFYKQLRNERNSGEIKGARYAALTIAINKLGFNGLYRVNSNGEYNVAFGGFSKKRALDLTNEIYNLSELFNAKNFAIHNKDYKEIFAMAQSGDFVYCDPPYDGCDAMYSQIWDYSKQLELKTELDKLTARGVKWLLSNADTQKMRVLYANYKITTINNKTYYYSGGDKKDDITEILVSNF